MHRRSLRNMVLLRGKARAESAHDQETFHCRNDDSCDVRVTNAAQPDAAGQGTAANHLRAGE